MSAAQIVDALAIPTDARVDQRVPKKMLVEQGSPTTPDKRTIQDGIDEIYWIAALKPTNIGVPAFRDDVREYLEIAVITVAMRAGAKAGRLTELIHRAIPYPVVLIAAQGDLTSLSFAHKRWSQGETGKVVIEDMISTSAFRPEAPAPVEASFVASLAVSALPNRDMYALYQGWLDKASALAAAMITGVFAAHGRLQREITVLRARAAKEKQLNRRVDMNLEIKRLEAELRNAAKTIGLGEA
jgi:hypothetical protein